MSTPRRYSDEYIWYTYDLRPNAPRVYFIVKDASDIEMSDNPVLNPGTKCLIVVGITDKSRQLDVLQRFTGKNRTVLINEGAGSV